MSESRRVEANSQLLEFLNNMKTHLLAASLGLCVLFLTQGAQAISLINSTHRDIDSMWVELNEDNPSYSDTLDLVNVEDSWDRPGFKPGVHKIDEAVLGFIFVEFSESVVASVTRANFSLGSFLTNGLSGLENQSGDYEVSLDSLTYGYLKGAVFLDIEQDGRLSWSVTLNDDDVQRGTSIVLRQAYLGVSVLPLTVPDSGSTAALLGFALFGALAARRRIAFSM